MTQEIIIHQTPDYIQVALCQAGQVQEIEMEALQTEMRVGDIYYAKVVRLLPDLGVAFVEIGGERTALLHFTDVCLPTGSGYTETAQYLRVGQFLIVQINKLPRGDKGAVVTGFVQLIGALLIYQPGRNQLKVAQRIVADTERQRLSAIFQQENITAAGIMVRSLAEEQTAENLLQELQHLQNEWQQVQTLAKEQRKPGLLRAEYNLACRFIRDRVNSGLSSIYADDPNCYAELNHYMNTWLWSWLPCLHSIAAKRSPWRTYKIDAVIEEAQSKKIGLPSGGFIVIERTEAMITVDVNTGQYVQGKRERDIVYQTNLEAARVLAKQLRIRNLGGIIVIDFIGMREMAQQQDVLAVLKEELAQDPAYTTLYGFTPLGLVEISRQRRGNSWLEFYK